MRVLDIKGSSSVASATPVTDDILTVKHTMDSKKTYSQTLLPILDEIVKSLDPDLGTLDAVAAAGNPGSFIGLRIGAVTAKGLGLVLRKSSIHVPTIDAMAYNMWGVAGLAYPIVDAKRSQVYARLYRTEDGLEVLMEWCPTDIRELTWFLNRRGEKVIFLGDGVPAYQKIIEKEMQAPHVFAPPQMNRRKTACVAALRMGAPGEDPTYKGAHVIGPEEFTPEYLRKLQAER